MKAEIKKRWLEALRSGQYKQCRGRLTNGKGFCCLGVLTNLYLLERGEMWERAGEASGEWDAGDIGTWDAFGDFDAENLSSQVQKWAGLDSPAPIAGGADLADHNDGALVAKRKSFAQIADLIEKHL